MKRLGLKIILEIIKDNNWIGLDYIQLTTSVIYLIRKYFRF